MKKKEINIQKIVAKQQLLVLNISANRMMFYFILSRIKFVLYITLVQLPISLVKLHFLVPEFPSCK